MAETKTYLTKIAIVRQWLEQGNKKIRFICPVYLCAKGFDPDVEYWLHEQGFYGGYE